jgi:hypothetical protein
VRAAQEETDAREESEINLVAARQNPVLREHFTRQYLGMDAWGGADASARLPKAGDDVRSRFVQQLIDRRIEHYVQQVQEKLQNLEKHVSNTVRLREGAWTGEAQARELWGDTLKQVEDQAKDLRNHLAGVLSDLPRRPESRPEASDTSSHRGFKEETEYILDRFNRAQKQIRDYFFIPTNVVDVSGLKDENMLILLGNIEDMAKDIRRRL